jgi:hypothetical protein
VDGLNFDPLERQPLVNAGQIFHVTREPVQRLHDDNCEKVLACRIHKLHQAIAAEY